VNPHGSHSSERPSLTASRGRVANVSRMAIDLLMIVIVIAFFGLAAALVAWLDRI
jgi:hypothetical protein